MVLAERNSELVRNGRRSRGPSPNGAGGGSGGGGGGGGGGGASSGISGASNGPGVTGGGTPETSSDDDNSIKRNGKSKTKQSEYEEKIRVGRDYQAVCPPLIPEGERKPEILNDRALLVWSPTKDIPDSRLEEYISVAKEKYGYNGEQALGMLFWHKHDLERAVMDLANFTPFPDEWTVEDKVLFEQAFQFHGKSFHRIRQMLPDKSIASLVKYYYSWKKTRHRQSVMDRQEKAKASKEGSENGSENGSNEESDNDDKDQILGNTLGTLEQVIGGGIGGFAIGSIDIKMYDLNDPDGENVVTTTTNKQHQQQLRQQTPPYSANANANTTSASTNANADSSCGAGGRMTPLSNGGGVAFGISIGAGGTGNSNSSNVANSGGSGGNGSGGGCCINCGVTCNVVNVSPHGKLCFSCHHHWRRTGNKRPTSGPYFGKRSRDRNSERHKRKPPRGMYINHDDIVALAGANDNQNTFLANTEREIVSLLSQVQLNKQNISALKRKNSENVDDIRPIENTNRIHSRWSNDELLLAVEGVRKYGKDFQMIAETIGTKSEAHVRTFYINYRRRYNLDQVYKKFEAEKEAAAVNANSTLKVVNTTNASTATAANILTTGVATAGPTMAGGSGVTGLLANAGVEATTSTSSSNATTLKKDDMKKKDIPGVGISASVGNAGATAATGIGSAIVDESDNTTSSETTISKTTFIINDDAKSSSNSSNAQKDNIIMEIDLDSEQSDSSPTAKKIALTVSNQDFPKASAV